MRRAVLYLRVSTDGQTTENQRPELLRLARQRGWRIVETYEETASAAKRRPEFDRMREAARQGLFDLLLIWSIDRFGRSMFGNLRDVLELEEHGVRVVSVREAFLDSDSPARHLLLAFMSWVAEQERARLVERTKAGMDRARAQGKQIGRPARLGYVELQKLERLLRAGKSQREIAVAMKVPRSTIRNALGANGRPRRVPKVAQRRASS